MEQTFARYAHTHTIYLHISVILYLLQEVFFNYNVTGCVNMKK